MFRGLGYGNPQQSNLTYCSLQNSNKAHFIQLPSFGRKEFMLTFLFSYYNLELQGVYMVPRSVVLSELDEMATRDAFTSIVLNTVFSGQIGTGVNKGI